MKYICIKLLYVLRLCLLKLKYGKRIKYGKKIYFSRSTEIICENNCVLKIGNNFFARKNFTIRGTNELGKNIVKITIGSNCFFNEGCSINAMDEIDIGDDCIFGENVHIYDHNHNYKDCTKLIREQGFNSKPVKIGNNCWIGTNVVVLKGVIIGNNSIIGAGCVIYKDVPSDSILLSNGRILKK